MGILDAIGLGRLREGLARTRENLVGRVATLVRSRTSIDDGLLDELEEILIAGDVGAGTALEIRLWNQLKTPSSVAFRK